MIRTRARPLTMILCACLERVDAAARAHSGHTLELPEGDTGSAAWRARCAGLAAQGTCREPSSCVLRWDIRYLSAVLSDVHIASSLVQSGVPIVYRGSILHVSCSSPPIDQTHVVMCACVQARQIVDAERQTAELLLPTSLHAKVVGTTLTKISDLFSNEYCHGKR